MNNKYNQKNNTEMSKEEESLLFSSKENVNKVLPEKALLTSILSKIEVKTVTDQEVVRNYSQERENKGRSFISINFNNLINNMNKYIKILSGSVAVSAIIVALVFISQNNDKQGLVSVVNNNVTETKVDVGGEVVDVDTLIAELSKIDASFEEPVVSDSDLSADLINSNSYEIQ